MFGVVRLVGGVSNPDTKIYCTSGCAINCTTNDPTAHRTTAQLLFMNHPQIIGTVLNCKKLNTDYKTRNLNAVPNPTAFYTACCLAFKGLPSKGIALQFDSCPASLSDLA